jgi:hypothetical protein
MRQLGRGTLLGLTLGAFIGAALLLAASFFAAVSCEGLSDTECAFEHQTHRENTARQRLMAAGLAVIGSGGLLWLRTTTKDKRT